MGKFDKPVWSNIEANPELEREKREENKKEEVSILTTFLENYEGEFLHNNDGTYSFSTNEKNISIYGFKISKIKSNYSDSIKYLYKIEKINSEKPIISSVVIENNKISINDLNNQISEIKKGGINNNDKQGISLLENQIKTFSEQNNTLENNPLFTEIKNQLLELRKQYENSQLITKLELSKPEDSTPPQTTVFKKSGNSETGAGETCATGTCTTPNLENQKAKEELVKENQTAETVAEAVVTSNLDSNSKPTEKDIKDLKNHIENSDASDSFIAKLLKALENFIVMLSGKEKNAYLDEHEGLVVEDLKGDAKEKFYDKETKYNETFKAILENTGYKKGKIILPKESDLGKVETPFALKIDTDGPNLFLEPIKGEDFSKQSAKVKISMKDKNGNFQYDIVEIKNLKKFVEAYDKKYPAIGDGISNKEIDGEVNIDKYSEIKEKLNDSEKKVYLKGVKAGIILETNGDKFTMLDGKEVSKSEMLAKVKEMNNNPKLFWEGYLNKLGINLEKNNSSSREKIIINLPGKSDLIFINNGNSKNIYEYNNGKIIEGDTIGITGMNVARLYPDQIVILAYALKNNIDLKSISDFNYKNIQGLMGKKINILQKDKAETIKNIGNIYFTSKISNSYTKKENSKTNSSSNPFSKIDGSQQEYEY